MRLGKKPRMQRAILLLLAGVMLSCLGIFLSLPQTIASEVPEVSAALAGEARGALDPPPEESYPLRATGDRQKKDELPVNASLLTMFVLAICSWGLEGGDRQWLAAAREGPSSLLGVFRL